MGRSTLNADQERILRTWQGTLSDLAKELGRSMWSIRGLRRSRGLVKTFDEIRAAQSASGGNYANARKSEYERFAIERGWPSTLKPREVQILNMLYQFGPKTKREIVAALGMKWIGARNSLKASGRKHKSYLSSLASLGLITQLPEKVRECGVLVNVYAVATDVRRGPVAEYLISRKESTGGKED